MARRIAAELRHRRNWGAYDTFNIYLLMEIIRTNVSVSPQVLIGFMGTSGLVILLVIIHYVVAFDPSTDPFSREDGSSAADDGGDEGWKTNSVDQIIVDLFMTMRSWLETRTKRKLRDILTKVSCLTFYLRFSNTQLGANVNSGYTDTL